MPRAGTGLDSTGSGRARVLGIRFGSGSGLAIFTFEPVGLKNYGLEPYGPLNFVIKPCDMGKSSFKKPAGFGTD